MDIAAWLKPMAAAGPAVVMVLAAATHVRRREWKRVLINVALFALAGFVALERFGPQNF